MEERSDADATEAEAARASMQATLARVTVVAAALYVLYGLSAFSGLRQPTWWLVTADLLASAALAATATRLRRRPVPLRELHALGYALVFASAARAAAGALVHREVYPAFFISFLVIGVGAIAVSRLATVAISAAVAASAIAVSLAVGTAHQALVMMLAMVTSLLLGLAILLGRHEATVQARRLRQGERARAAELAAALARLEAELLERQKAQAERAALEARLSQAQRLDALGTLAGGVAHDINNVLAAVVSLAEAARDDQPVGARARQDLAQILEAAHRGAVLTGNLLGFAGRGKHRHVALHLDEVAAQVLARLRPTAPAGVQLVAALTPGCVVMGDPAQLGQAVANLVLNAMQALAGQGTVRVHTARAVLGDGESAVLAAGGRVVTLEVIDDGVGMDPEALAHAFEPFFSGKAATSIRRGLGLAMVYGALRDHQGEVQLRSVPGQGTTATLRLPEAEPQPAQAQRAPAQAPGDGLFGAVLVIDDERLVRAAVRRLLRSQGVECVEAASGAEALEHFRTRPHAFALVVLDLSMPEMSGAECFAHLRRIDATVPILVASGYPKDQHVETLLAAGPAEFLAKPFAREEFLMAAVQCCSRAPRRPGLRAAEAAPT